MPPLSRKRPPKAMVASAMASSIFLPTHLLASLVFSSDAPPAARLPEPQNPLPNPDPKA